MYLQPPQVSVRHSGIINGTVDSADPSVLEIMYVTGYPASACGGNQSCLQGCTDTSTMKACTSGATCWCGMGGACTGELVGPKSVLTAGHCTDLTAGGELSGQGGPALKICSSGADLNNLFGQKATSNGCNLGVLVLFNNKCTTNDTMETCESSLLKNGDYIYADQAVNPSYTQGGSPDNDIGLIHLTNNLLANATGEPDILYINRTSLGAKCSDLGQIKFVGYGITSAGSMTSGVKYTVMHDTKVADGYHLRQGQVSGCTAAGSGGVTCQGDSGGPELNAKGEIIGVTSLGDVNCSSFNQDTRVDAYASWIDTTMMGWGDPKNGTFQTPDGGGANACDVCFNAAQNGACMNQADACNNDQACIDFSNCLGGCASGNTTCVNNCKTTAGATAVMELQAIFDCACTMACVSECASSCPAPSADMGGGGGGGGGGTGGGGTGGGVGGGGTGGDVNNGGAGGQTSQSSGCSFGGTPAPSLPVVVLLGFVLVGGARRRRA
ncbi:MAG: trypsin-like serine protease [Ilumatobacteraceae bacterium]